MRLRKGAVPMVPFPSFLRRALRLAQARRALVRGAPDEALSLLRDPSLVLSRRAEWMRSRTLEELCRSAARRAAAGRDASTARLLAMVQSEDPERARAWRRELVPEPEPDADAPSTTRDALRGLLGELREARAAGVPGATGSASSPPADAGTEASNHAVPGEAPVAAPDARLARLVVDDGGEALLALGRAVTLGHLRSSEAELVFLADVEARHARLAWCASFHGGAGWRVEPLAGAVTVDGRAVPPGGEALAEGAHVALAQNLRFVFRQPDPSSSGAVLELAGGVECHGAARVLLCVPGPGGRLTLGPGARAHVVVRSLESDLSLEVDGPSVPDARSSADAPSAADGAARLRLASDGGVRVPGGELARELAFAWPPRAPVEVTVGGRVAGRAPLFVALQPLPAHGPSPEPAP